MIEIFKTNVEEDLQAAWLISLIHRHFPGHEANFDLQDCDKILRVKSVTNSIDSSRLIHFVAMHGIQAELLV